MGKEKITIAELMVTPNAKDFAHAKDLVIDKNMAQFNFLVNGKKVFCLLFEKTGAALHVRELSGEFLKHTKLIQEFCVQVAKSMGFKCLTATPAYDTIAKIYKKYGWTQENPTTWFLEV